MLSRRVDLMLSQPESAFNFRHIMDEGQILLVNLAGLGPEVREIVGCLMLSLLHLTALGRRDTPPDQRRPFHIYCDERSAGRIAAAAQVQTDCRQRRPVERHPAVLLPLAEHVQHLRLFVDAHIVNVERAELAVADTRIEQEDTDVAFAAHVLPRERRAGPAARLGLDRAQPAAGLFTDQWCTFLLDGEAGARDAVDRVVGQVFLADAPAEELRQRGEVVGDGLTASFLLETVIPPARQVAPLGDRAVCGVGGFQITPHFLRTFGSRIRRCFPDNDLSDGGGGNRTPVPMHFSLGFYVHSRSI